MFPVSECSNKNLSAVKGQKSAAKSLTLPCSPNSFPEGLSDRSIARHLHRGNTAPAMVNKNNSTAQREFLRSKQTYNATQEKFPENYAKNLPSLRDINTFQMMLREERKHF